MSRRTLAVIAILIAGWALCCLVVPNALWDSYMHDARRYALFGPSGEFLPIFVPACIGSVIVSVVAALAAAGSMRVMAVRVTVLILAAMAVSAALVVSLFGTVLVAASCLMFFVAMALTYIVRAERAFGKPKKGDRI